jgi:hypothetical protein
MTTKGSPLMIKKVLLELDGFLCEKGREQELFFTKSIHIHVYINLD